MRLCELLRLIFVEKIVKHFLPKYSSIPEPDVKINMVFMHRELQKFSDYADSYREMHLEDDTKSNLLLTLINNYKKKIDYLGPTEKENYRKSLDMGSYWNMKYSYEFRKSEELQRIRDDARITFYVLLNNHIDEFYKNENEYRKMISDILISHHPETLLTIYDKDPTISFDSLYDKHIGMYKDRHDE